MARSDRWHRPPLRTRLWNILRYKAHDLGQMLHRDKEPYATDMQEPPCAWHESPALLSWRRLALAGLLALLGVICYRVVCSEHWFKDHYPTLASRKTFSSREAKSRVTLDPLDAILPGRYLRVVIGYNAADGETTYVRGVITRNFGK